MKSIPSLVLFLLLAPLLSQAAHAAESVELDWKRNVVYKQVEGGSLELDICHPVDGNKTYSLIVLIHGGGFQAGNRQSYHPVMPAFAEKGFAVATVSYRFAPKHQFPSQVEDVTAAIHFLRKHSARYSINPEKIGLLGDSAGASIALLTALGANNEIIPEAAQVDAVVNLFGAYDFRTFTLPPGGEDLLKRSFKKPLIEMIADYVGTTNRSDPRMAKASPATWADDKDPPVLTFQGTADPLVPAKEAIAFHEALKKKGTKERLVLLEGAGHGFSGKDQERVIQEATEFFQKELR